ncbi:MAG: hypothetical protein NWF01_07195 [Candidatus Bathyarchaeota archaeon]|nr:hypothetical protein [Candidatus Bathyarchaeota archaeon]
MVSLRVGQGDICLVNLVEDWMVLEQYAGEKRGFYQIIGVDGNFEVRVQTGRVGYIKQFKRADDPRLIKILDFCKKHHYIQIIQRIRGEKFFK